MTVYVLEVDTGDSWEVIGVYSSDEKAREAAAKDSARGTYAVTDVELDAPAAWLGDNLKIFTNTGDENV